MKSAADARHALASASRLCVHGRRRYRVWWIDGQARAVAWPVGVMPASGGRRRRLRRIALLLAALAALGAGCADTRWLTLTAACLGVLAWFEHLEAPRRREAHLRRNGGRAGPWIWAIDTGAAVLTARIRAGLEVPAAQARRTPSMRIQSPSCSQARSSNHAW